MLCTEVNNTEMPAKLLSNLGNRKSQNVFGKIASC